MEARTAYTTTYGSFINVEKVKDELMSFLGVNTMDLSYDYLTETSCKIVIITGCSAEEKELPIWEHPLVFESLNNDTIVAIDLRKYVKPSVGKPDSLEDIVKDIGGLKFSMLRTLLTAEFIEGNFGVLRSMNKHFVPAIAIWLSDIINAMITLNPVEKMNVELAVSFYYNQLMIADDDREEMKDAIVARMQTYKLSLPVTRTNIKNIVDKLSVEDCDLDDLLSLIGRMLPEDKANVIDANALINLTANSWYGPGGSEVVIMGLEDIPTWVTLLYSALSNKTFKRSRLATMLEKIGTKVKGREFIKLMDIYIKENMVIRS